MKIQKGIVKYKDRTDIVCTYGVTDAGVQYYFLDEKDEKKFSNGNRIASTELVEAIDPMYKASHIGVIDSVGNVVIPFDNKSIRPVNDDIILVEKAKPVSQSVIDAINLKSDPLAATKLVSTPATIKDKLNSKMGPEGRYVFNDQFSEATVYDINGNNLVNDECFSFIGLANGKLYFSKNTVDSEITEYSVLPPEVQSDVTPASDTKEIDVGDVSVSKDVIEGALNNETAQESVAEEPTKLDEKEEHVQETVQNDSLVMPSVEADGEETVENNSESNGENNNVDDLDATMNIPFPTGMTPDEIAALAKGIESSEDELASKENEEKVPVEDVVGEKADEVSETSDSEEKDATGEKSILDGLELPGDTTETEKVEEPSEEVASEEKDAVEEKGILDNIELPGETIEAEKAEESSEEIASEEKDTAEEKSILDDLELPGETMETEKAEESSEKVASEEDATTEEKNDLDNIVLPEETSEAEKAEKSSEEVASEEKDAVEEQNAWEDMNLPEEKVISEEIEETSSSAEGGVVVEDDLSVNEDAGDLKLDLGDSTVDFKDSDLDVFGASEVVDEFTTDGAIGTAFDGSDLEEDIDDYHGAFEEGDVISNRDTIMEDVAKSMTSLIAQNKEQKAKIVKFEQENMKLRASRQNVIDKANHQEKKIDMLVGKLKSLEGTLSKLEANNRAFEKKVHDQERVIASQNRELEAMKAQLDGKDDLVQLLADAQALLGQDSTFDYDADSSYYKKVA